MFDPDPELVSTHRVELPTGEAIVFDQSLWGKVIEIRELWVAGGRYGLDDYLATAELRRLLEAASVGGSWAAGLAEEVMARIRDEVRDVIARLYGEADEW